MTLHSFCSAVTTTRRIAVWIAAGLTLALAGCGTTQTKAQWDARPSEKPTRINLVFVHTRLNANGMPVSDDAPALRDVGYGDFSSMFSKVAPVALAKRRIDGNAYTLDDMVLLAPLIRSQHASSPSDGGHWLVLYFTGGMAGTYGGAWAQMNLDAKLLPPTGGAALWTGTYTLTSRTTPFGGKKIDELMIGDTLDAMLQAIQQ